VKKSPTRNGGGGFWLLTLNPEKTVIHEVHKFSGSWPFTELLRRQGDEDHDAGVKEKTKSKITTEDTGVP
jgi:hypothetical protein